MPKITADVFEAENERVRILRDAVTFFRVPDKVHAGNLRGKNGYDLKDCFPVTYRIHPADGSQTPEQVLRTLVSGVEEFEWSRIECPLPSSLVWGENWEDLLDRHFFVDTKAVFGGPNEILEQ
jgi:hypothetical protein